MLFEKKNLIGKVLAEEFAIFRIKLSFLTNIPCKRILKQFKKSVHGLCQSLPFLDLTWLSFSSTVCHQSLKLKGRKFSLHPYACDLAVGFGSAARAAKLSRLILQFVVLIKSKDNSCHQTIQSSVNHRKKEVVGRFHW